MWHISSQSTCRQWEEDCRLTANKQNKNEGNIALCFLKSDTITYENPVLVARNFKAAKTTTSASKIFNLKCAFSTLTDRLLKVGLDSLRICTGEWKRAAECYLVMWWESNNPWPAVDLLTIIRKWVRNYVSCYVHSDSYGVQEQVNSSPLKYFGIKPILNHTVRVDTANIE